MICRVTVYIVAAAAVVSCSAPNIPEPKSRVHHPHLPDSIAPIRTSSTLYQWIRTRDWWEVRIPITYVNSSPDTLFIFACSGDVDFGLERLETPGWAGVWSKPVRSCFSTPEVILPHDSRVDTVLVVGTRPGMSVEPSFRDTLLEGRFRLVWNDLHVNCRSDTRSGERLPLHRSYSNTFTLRNPPEGR
jgi:hypothetical protein